MIKLEKTNKYTEVYADDIVNGVPHRFVITSDDGTVGVINFQSGPIGKVGINGIFNEDLLLMCMTRLEAFQNTEYICVENEFALEYIRLALGALQSRTSRREAERVEGTHNV